MHVLEMHIIHEKKKQKKIFENLNREKKTNL